MKTILHNHLLLNGVVSTPPVDVEAAKSWLRQLVADIDMKIVTGPHIEYVEAVGNRGMTGCVGIETSHIAFHVWDEKDPAFIQFDLYTCSHLPVELAIQSLTDFMGLMDYQYIVLNRENGFFNTLSNSLIPAHVVYNGRLKYKTGEFIDG